jgi:quercetin dioxygenase-like cupin family protein
MHEKTDVGTMTAGLAVGVTRSARDSGMAKLTTLHREVVSGMPAREGQEIRVLEAVLLPGDVTPYHCHRHPVTVYMLEGIFTLELDGQAPVDIAAGDVLVEPSGVNMTGSNRGDVPARMALFYVCDPNEPFADPVARV